MTLRLHGEARTKRLRLPVANPGGAAATAVRSRRPKRWDTSAAADRSRYADPARRLGIGSAKNYFTYFNPSPRPQRSAADIVTAAVFDALGLKSESA